MKFPSGPSVRQMRSRTRHAIAGYRVARRAAGLAMRQSLVRHRAAVIAGLRAVFTGDGLSPAHGLYTDRTGVWELWPAPCDEQERKTDHSDELLQVVRIVQKHPEGICARDIGNEMGTDWRRVFGLTRSLVESGLLDQVDETYYPVGTVLRR